MSTSIKAHIFSLVGSPLSTSLINQASQSVPLLSVPRLSVTVLQLWLHYITQQPLSTLSSFVEHLVWREVHSQTLTMVLECVSPGTSLTVS